MPDIIAIAFHGHDLQSWKNDETGIVYAAMRPMVEHFGMDWSAQFRRLKRDELFRDRLSVVTMATVQGPRDFIGLDVDALPMWLATIQRQRVKEAHRETLLLYQRECAKALRDYWFTGQANNPRQQTSEDDALLATLQALVQVRKDQLEMHAELQKVGERVKALESNTPPASKWTVFTYLKDFSKPYLHVDVMDAFKAACRRLEEPQKFTPQGMDYPLFYYTLTTLDTAYVQATRQLSFLDKKLRQKGA